MASIKEFTEFRKHRKETLGESVTTGRQNDSRRVIQLVMRHCAALQRRQLSRLYREDARFREICRHYAICVDMQNKYARDSHTLEAKRFQAQYEDLVKSLMAEVLAMVVSTETGGER